MCISLCITSVDKQNNIFINQIFEFILLFLQGTIPFHFITFQHTSPPPLKRAKSGLDALNMVSVHFKTLHDPDGIVDGTHGSISQEISRAVYQRT